MGKVEGSSGVRTNTGEQWLEPWDRDRRLLDARLDSTADRMASERAEVAVVAALAPICVAKFEAQADASKKLVEFKKVSTSWDQSSFIENGGWATMPGSATPNSAVAHSCAEKLGSPI